MQIEKKGNNVYLHGVKDFCLSHVFDCGQCFRWDRLTDNSYIGVAMGKALKIEQYDNEVILHDTNIDDYYNVWEKYFDFNRDYSEIKQILSKDIVLKDAVAYGQGIRILKQDIWECVISFIISASNNIPRIKKIISSLSENFGEKIEYMGNVYYSFPNAETVSKLSLDDLAIIRAGYRDKYILSAAKMFATGEICIDDFYKLSAIDAKKKLITINGVGEKVSDCIMLFGLGKYEYFPIDVWMKRVMEYYYFDGEKKIDEIREFSYQKFGELSGFAQQYLFFYGRDNKIGV